MSVLRSNLRHGPRTILFAATRREGGGMIRHGAPRQQSSEPGPMPCAVDFGIADHGERTCREPMPRPSNRCGPKGQWPRRSTIMADAYAFATILKWRLLIVSQPGANARSCA